MAPSPWNLGLGSASKIQDNISLNKEIFFLACGGAFLIKNPSRRLGRGHLAVLKLRKNYYRFPPGPKHLPLACLALLRSPSIFFSIFSYFFAA